VRENRFTTAGYNFPSQKLPPQLQLETFSTPHVGGQSGPTPQPGALRCRRYVCHYAMPRREAVITIRIRVEIVHGTKSLGDIAGGIARILLRYRIADRLTRELAADRSHNHGGTGSVSYPVIPPSNVDQP